MNPKETSLLFEYSLCFSNYSFFSPFYTHLSSSLDSGIDCKILNYINQKADILFPGRLEAFFYLHLLRPDLLKKAPVVLHQKHRGTVGANQICQLHSGKDINVI